MRVIELTNGFGETIYLDACRLNCIRDMGESRVVFIDDGVTWSVQESSGEIIERIYAAESGSSGVMMAVMMVTALLAGLAIGLLF
jgi:hypothetical protein